MKKSLERLKNYRTRLVINEIGDTVTLSEDEMKIYNRLVSKEKQSRLFKRNMHNDLTEKVYAKMLERSNPILYENYVVSKKTK